MFFHVYICVFVSDLCATEAIMEQSIDLHMALTVQLD